MLNPSNAVNFQQNKLIFQFHMINMIRILFLTILNIGICLISHSQNIILKQSNPTGVYYRGEKIKVTVSIDGIGIDSVAVNVVKNYVSNPKWNNKKYSGGEMVLYEGAWYEPASMIFEVKAGTNYAGIGLIVEPEKFEPGTKRPRDFDNYWNAEKDNSRALPMEIKSVPMSNFDSDYDCSDVEINCLGTKPARGYFAKPKNAKPGSLPIVLNLHAAGVKGDWCLSKPSIALDYAKKGNGALAFDLNAHGMLNGQSNDYYNDLENGELKNYWEIGLENREEFYFRGMYLRLLRTLDFLCNQPEWDGKRIIVTGESQGGGQALAAAGLDDRVTAAVATVPAMCDFGRELNGEKGGWPNPFGYPKNKDEMMNTIPYFDDVHILKNSKATLVVEIGLIDYTCPSVGIYAALNQAKGKKILYAVPYRGHHQNQPGFQKEWEEMVYKPKMKFIEDFLR